MREQGKGIPRMFGEMTTQFLPAPVVEVGSKTFKVTLKNTPNITAATAEWLGNIAREGLGENQVHALVLTLQHGAVTNAELRTGGFPGETGNLPAETGNLPAETGNLPAETGNLGRVSLMPEPPAALPDFLLGVKEKLLMLLVQRRDRNEKMVTKVLDDDDFQKAVLAYLAERIYEDARG